MKELMKMVMIDGLRLTGEFVEGLKDKSFTVVKMVKKLVKDPNTQGDIQKWVLDVKTVDGKMRDWIPNNSVLQMLADRFGDESDKWIGKVVKLKVVEQNVRGQFRKVVYVE